MRNLRNIKNLFNLRPMGFLMVFGCLFFGSLMSASAQGLVTFAQYVNRGGTGQNYIFTNNTSNATFNTISGGAPIRFFYNEDVIVGLDPSLTGTQNAVLFLTSSTSAPATLSGNTLIQTINNPVNTIQITRTSPTAFGVGSGARTNLLTVTFSPIGSVAPSLTGADGGNSASFSATTPDHIVTFTSDFLNFSSSTARNLALSFTSVLPNLSSGNGGFLNNFNAAGTGTFSSNPVPTVVGPTAASVTVSGRVLTPSGRGLRNAQITATQADGSTRTILTGVYGAYTFGDLPVGQTVILSVRSKSYRFVPQIVTPGADLSGIDFVPEAK